MTLVAPAREVTCYGYDALDRLAFVRADALGLDAATYRSYDPVGNRVCLLDAESHPSYISYDALGRLASDRAPAAKIEMADATARATDAAPYVSANLLAPWFPELRWR